MFAHESESVHGLCSKLKDFSRSKAFTYTCGSFSFWCWTLGPYHTSPAQPPLASGAAHDHSQDRGPCVEMYPCLSTGSTYTSGEVSEVVLVLSFTVCVASGVELPRVLTSTGQRSFSFHGPTVWNRLLCATAVSHWTRSRSSWRLICLMDSNCTPASAIVAFCDFGVVYKCHDLLTYLHCTVVLFWQWCKVKTLWKFQWPRATFKVICVLQVFANGNIHTIVQQMVRFQLT